MSPGILRTLLIAAMTSILVSPAVAAPATQAELPPSLGLDEQLEGQLDAALADLTNAVDVGKIELDRLAAALNNVHLPRLIGKIASARKLAGGLWKLADPAASQPDAQVVFPGRAPMVRLGGATVWQIEMLWLEQLRMNVHAADGMFRGQRAVLSEWAEGAARSDPKRRAAPIAQALREADRAARLLCTAAPDIVVVKPGEQLFADDFSRGADNWDCYGDCRTANEKDAFRFTDTTGPHPDAMMWTKREFDGNFAAEFTFIPWSRGARPGALFTICGRPRPGKDFSVCVGESMDTYNYGIDGYHFSMHRGNTGLGNVRRVGPGLKMLASGPDPAPKIGQAYRVCVAKWGSTIMLLVDGKLIHHYVDAGTYGPALTAGRIGLRHWGGMDGSYRDFRVYRLVPAR